MADTKETKAEAAADSASEAARKAELDRQDAQREAVAKAGREDLPKLGGAMKNPGLGR